MNIGEASADIRDRVCRQLSFLGVKLEDRLNERASGDSVISPPGSQIHVLVVRAREELGRRPCGPGRCWPRRTIWINASALVVAAETRSRYAAESPGS